MVNQYPGKCFVCHKIVDPGKGILTHYKYKWEVFHNNCLCLIMDDYLADGQKEEKNNMEASKISFKNDIAEEVPLTEIPIGSFFLGSMWEGNIRMTYRGNEYVHLKVSHTKVICMGTSANQVDCFEKLNVDTTRVLNPQILDVTFSVKK